MKQTCWVLVLVARVVGCYRQHATRRRFSEIAQRMASLSPLRANRWLPSGDTKGWFEEACRATLNAGNQEHHPRKMQLPGERICYFCHHRRRRRSRHQRRTQLFSPLIVTRLGATADKTRQAADSCCSKQAIPFVFLSRYDTSKPSASGSWVWPLFEAVLSPRVSLFVLRAGAAAGHPLRRPFSCICAKHERAKRAFY